MSNTNKWIPVLMVAIVGAFLQLIFISVDNKDTATGAAIEFVSAYYMLDSDAMKSRIHEDSATQGEVDLLDEYLHAKKTEAAQRGFNLSYLQFSLSHVDAKVIELGEEKAEIMIHAKKRRCIHPVFTFVAKIFFIGQSHDVDQTYKLVKVEGKWKVTDGAFSPNA